MGYTVKKALKQSNPDALLIQGHDDALIGIAGRHLKLVAVYSYEKIERKLQESGMSSREATDFITFTIPKTYWGDDSPIIVFDGYEPEKDTDKST